jgi:hypothetical protein
MLIYVFFILVKKENIDVTVGHLFFFFSKKNYLEFIISNKFIYNRGTVFSFVQDALALLAHTDNYNNNRVSFPCID